jgi:hypothetical protein
MKEATNYGKNASRIAGQGKDHIRTLAGKIVCLIHL